MNYNKKNLADELFFNMPIGDILSIAEYASRTLADDDKLKSRLRSAIRTIDVAVKDVHSIVHSLEAGMAP